MSGEDMQHEPIYLRPSRRPQLVRVLVTLLLPAAALVLAGAPVWLFMNGDARRWSDDVRVTARSSRAPVSHRSPTGQPDHLRFDVGSRGRLSDRGRGQRSLRRPGVPEAGGTVSARLVDDDQALTGFHGFLLHWALASPYLTSAGLGLRAARARTDPVRSTVATATDLPDA